MLLKLPPGVSRLDIAAIKRRSRRWFEPDARGALRSRAGDYGFSGPGGTTFVTSECYGGEPRQFTVWLQRPGGAIEAAGPRHKTRRAAEEAAAVISGRSRT